MAVFSRLAVVVQLFNIFITPTFSAVVQQYDYVIVGGGVTGLVVANRLSEDKSSTPCLTTLSDQSLTISRRVGTCDRGRRQCQH